MVDKDSQKILVTGVTGFIGSELLRVLPKSRLRLATRDPTTALHEYSAIHVGDINGRTDWAPALRDVECVIHLAGRAHVMSPSSEHVHDFYETNVAGTKRLAEMAAAAGVKRFIFLSSIKVNGDVTTEKPFAPPDESRPSDDYGRSKLQAEQYLMAMASREQTTIIIRPPLVYGPAVKANFLKLLSLVDRHGILPLGAIQNRRSLVSVWNLVDLIKTVVDAPKISSGVLMVSDGHDISTPELIRFIAMAMRRKTNLLKVPVHILRALGVLTGARAQISRLCDSLVVDISQTRAQLSWSPPISLEESISRTVQWYVAERGSGAR